MRFELQQLFDSGYPSLAYQLQAMLDKEPENLDDLENLVTLLDNTVEQIETRIMDAFDQGHNEGFSEAEWHHAHKYEEGYDDGIQEGYADGFQDGIKQGLNSQGYQD